MSFTLPRASDLSDPPHPDGADNLNNPTESRDAIIPSRLAPTPSWDRIVEEHWDEVYRHARRLCGYHRDAEDLTQETFVRAFIAVGSFRNWSLSGWLRRIATYAFRDRMRRKALIRFDPLPADTEPAATSERDHPEVSYLWWHLDPSLEAALSGLPAELRTTLRLRVLGELSDPEIAQTLGFETGTVRSRVCRARERMPMHTPTTRPSRSMTLWRPTPPAAGPYSSAWAVSD
jgi:RNA polymerase sigma factor (sigma-70 family)